MATINVTDDNTTIYVGDNDVVKINITGGGTVTIKADSANPPDFFKIHFIGDDHSDVAKIDLATFSANDLRIDIHHYDPTDEVQLLGGFNKYVDPNDEDEFHFSYIGSTGGTFNGYVHAQDGGESDFNADPSQIVICFAEGTIIDTALGPRLIEEISENDLVLTEDHGLQPVRWIGSRRLDSLNLARHPELAPILIKSGALGGNAPYVDLRVSPQHRLLLSDWRAEYLFGDTEVLVAAKHLVNDNNILVDHQAASVTYFHLLFDRHEVIYANGVPSESLYPGDLALDAIDPAARNEIELIFGDASSAEPEQKTAHRVLRGFEADAIESYVA